jgi:hypothetical protein
LHPLPEAVPERRSFRASARVISCSLCPSPQYSLRAHRSIVGQERRKCKSRRGMWPQHVVVNPCVTRACRGHAPSAETCILSRFLLTGNSGIGMIRIQLNRVFPGSDRTETDSRSRQSTRPTAWWVGLSAGSGRIGSRESPGTRTADHAKQSQFVGRARL